MKNTVPYLFLFSVIFAVACSKSDNNTNSHAVKYRIGGTAKMNVTYTDQTMTVRTATGVDSTWSYSFNTTADGKMVALYVISQDSTDVSGRIFIDNQQAAQNNGSNKITVSAQVP